MMDVQARGGGDTAEGVVGGLAKSVALDWAVRGSGTTCVLVHIADAPCHGARFHDISCDDFKHEVPTGGLAALGPFVHLTSLRQKGVQYFFGRINSSTGKMVTEMNFELEAEPRISTTLVADASKLSKAVTKVLRTSVMRTLSVAGGGALATFVPYGSNGGCAGARGQKRTRRG